MATPSIQTLITQAQQVLNLQSSNEIRATLAAVLANANVGTPLNPNLTTQQLWDEFYEIVRQPSDDIMSIITDQMMRMVYAPPAPGGVGANSQVIFNDGGVLAGDAGLVYNKTTDALTVAGLVTAGSATITGALTVDTTTLVVDSTNDRVGIGTATPGAGYVLDVVGAARITAANGLVIDKAGAGFVDFLNSGNSGANVGTSGTGGLVIYTANGIGGAYGVRYVIDSTGISTWSVAGTTAMTLNSTGLGVGIVPSSFGRFSVQGTAGGAGILGMNTDATQCDIQSYNKPLALNRAGNNITMCEGGGNVGIGVTPNSWSSAYKFLMLPNGGSLFNDTTNSIYLAANYYALAGSRKIASGYALNLQLDAAAGAYKWFTSLLGAGTAGDAVSFNQAMTLDASGNLLVGTTAVGMTAGGVRLKNGGGNLGEITLSNNSGAADYVARFVWGSGATLVGNITVSSVATVYNTTSDYRLKESVKPLSGGLARVNALKPSVYNWKSDGSTGEGFLAHELAEVVPAAVTGEKDAVNADGSIKSQGIDMSRVVPILVAAIQELTAEVNALKNA